MQEKERTIHPLLENGTTIGPFKIILRDQENRHGPIIDRNAAPPGYIAVFKSAVSHNKPLGNLCRACEWRAECQRNTEWHPNNRCMPWAREDGCSVVFMRRERHAQ